MHALVLADRPAGCSPSCLAVTIDHREGGVGGPPLVSKTDVIVHAAASTGGQVVDLLARHLAGSAADAQGGVVEQAVAAGVALEVLVGSGIRGPGGQGSGAADQPPTKSSS